MSTARKTPEVMIDNEVHRAAAARAESQDMALAAVIRQILQQAAAGLPPVKNKTVVTAGSASWYEHSAECREMRAQARLTTRGRKLYSLCQCRTRVRYTMSAEKYEAVTALIKAHGKTLTEVIERGLLVYANTGEIDGTIMEVST